MISKFPVQGKLDEYKVSVNQKYVCLGMYSWEVVIYKYNPNKIFFKHKKLYTYNSGWNHYKDWIGKYVELAKEVVKEYEDEIIQERNDEINHQKGLKQFAAWDGKLKK
jgi:hypothetical protein